MQDKIKLSDSQIDKIVGLSLIVIALLFGFTYDTVKSNDQASQVLGAQDTVTIKHLDEDEDKEDIQEVEEKTTKVKEPKEEVIDKEPMTEILDELEVVDSSPTVNTHDVVAPEPSVNSIQSNNQPVHIQPSTSVESTVNAQGVEIITTTNTHADGSQTIITETRTPVVEQTIETSTFTVE